MGKRNQQIDWTYADWHAFAVVLIRKHGVHLARTLLYLMWTARLWQRLGKWSIKSMPLQSTFSEYCRLSDKQINQAWYWDNTRYKVQGKCLENSLRWLENLTLLGDQELSNIDWMDRSEVLS